MKPTTNIFGKSVTMIWAKWGGYVDWKGELTETILGWAEIPNDGKSHEYIWFHTEDANHIDNTYDVHISEVQLIPQQYLN
jgi:hypothetical protein